MDEPLGMENEMEYEQEAPSAEVEEASSQYLHAWKLLVSTTNWDKGQIICQWRQALIDAGAPAQSYSDEAWSRRVGNVTGQHVGRLRRVHERFADSHDTYKGLFWSHFQAALDWDDAETWLEGAVQEGRSVAKMRDLRWESMGAPEDKKPREEDIVTAEFNEDVNPADDSPADTISESSAQVQPADDGPTDMDGEAPFDADLPPGDGDYSPTDSDQPEVDLVRPFEDVPQLPDDLQEAFEQFKLAIIRHRSAKWRDVSCDDVLLSLTALKQLALAPAGD